MVAWQKSNELCQDALSWQGCDAEAAGSVLPAGGRLSRVGA